MITEFTYVHSYIVLEGYEETRWQTANDASLHVNTNCVFITSNIKHPPTLLVTSEIAVTFHTAEEDIRFMQRKGEVQTLETKPRICHVFR